MGVDLGPAYGRIDLDVSGVDRAVAQANRALSGMENRWRSAGQRLSAVGGRLSLAVTAPIALIGGAAAKAAIDFESAFAGVRKTVDASEAEFQRLSAGLQDMATDTDRAVAGMPNAQVQLAGIMEIAGQLGVRGVDNLQTFTETVAQLSLTTNLTAEAAATELARFANIMNMPIENVDRLGSTVVDLGNKMATTEAEIVTMAQRLAGAGHVAGLSEADVLGLAAALSSVGIRAEAGGTAMSRVMVLIDQAVRSHGQRAVDNTERIGEATEDLVLLQDELAQAQEALAGAEGDAARIRAERSVEAIQAEIAALQESVGWWEDAQGAIVDVGYLDQWARIAGLSAAEFKQAWETDAGGALAAFVEGLGRMEAEGEDVYAVLADLGIENVRMTDALVRMAGAQGLLARAMDIAGVAWEENSALQEEARKRFETTEAQLNLLKNTLTGLAIVIGDAILPLINGLVGALAPFLRRLAGAIRGFTQAHPEATRFAVALAALAAALGPVLLLVGKVLTVVGALNPVIGAVIVAVGGLAFAFETNLLGVRDAVEQGIAVVSVFLGMLSDVLAGRGLRERAAAFFQTLHEAFGLEVAADLFETLMRLAERAGAVLAQVRDALSGAAADLAAGVPLGDVLRDRFGVDLSAIEDLWAGLQALWDTYVDPVLDTIIQGVGTFVNALLAGQSLQDALNDAFGIDITPVTDTVNRLLAAWDQQVQPHLDDLLGRVRTFIADLGTVGQPVEYAGPEEYRELFETLGPARVQEMADQLGALGDVEAVFRRRTLGDVIAGAFGIDPALITQLETVWNDISAVVWGAVNDVYTWVKGNLDAFFGTLAGEGEESLAARIEGNFAVGVLAANAIQTAWDTLKLAWEGAIKPFAEWVWANFTAFWGALAGESEESLAARIEGNFAVGVLAANLLRLAWEALGVAWERVVKPFAQWVIGNFQAFLGTLAGESEESLAARIEGNFGLGVLAANLIRLAWNVLNDVWLRLVKPFAEWVVAHFGTFLDILREGGTLKEALLAAFSIDVTDLENALAPVMAFVRGVGDMIGEALRVAASPRVRGPRTVAEMLDPAFTGVERLDLADLFLRYLNVDLTPLITAIENAWAGVERYVGGIVASLREFFASFEGMTREDLENLAIGIAAVLAVFALPAVAAALPAIAIGVAVLAGAVATIAGVAAALPDIREFFTHLGELLRNVSEGKWDQALWSLGDAVRNLWDAIGSFLVGGAQGLADLLGLDVDVREGLAAWEGVAANIGTIFDTLLIQPVGNAIAQVKGTIQGAWDFLFDPAYGVLPSTLDNLRNKWDTFWGEGGPVQNALNDLREKWNAFWRWEEGGTLYDAVHNLVDGLTGLWHSFWMWEEGGVIYDAIMSLKDGWDWFWGEKGPIQTAIRDALGPIVAMIQTIQKEVARIFGGNPEDVVGLTEAEADVVARQQAGEDVSEEEWKEAFESRYAQRQRGGRVRRGVPYWVGEGGPELFAPATSGRILDALESALLGLTGRAVAPALVGAGAGGGGATYHTQTTNLNYSPNFAPGTDPYEAQANFDFFQMATRGQRGRG